MAKPTKRVFPFRVKLSAEDFHSLLKSARRQSPVARRLSAADDATNRALKVAEGSKGK